LLAAHVTKIILVFNVLAAISCALMPPLREPFVARGVRFLSQLTSQQHDRVNEGDARTFLLQVGLTVEEMEEALRRAGMASEGVLPAVAAAAPASQLQAAYPTPAQTGAALGAAVATGMTVSRLGMLAGGLKYAALGALAGYLWSRLDISAHLQEYLDGPAQPQTQPQAEARLANAAPASSSAPVGHSAADDAFSSAVESVRAVERETAATVAELRSLVRELGLGVTARGANSDGSAAAAAAAAAASATQALVAETRLQATGLAASVAALASEVSALRADLTLTHSQPHTQPRSVGASGAASRRRSASSDSHNNNNNNNNDKDIFDASGHALASPSRDLSSLLASASASASASTTVPPGGTDADVDTEAELTGFTTLSLSGEVASARQRARSPPPPPPLPPPAPPPAEVASKAVAALAACNPLPSLRAALPSLSLLLSNIVTHGVAVPRYRRMPVTNDTFKRGVLGLAGAPAFLTALGFAEDGLAWRWIPPAPTPQQQQPIAVTGGNNNTSTSSAASAAAAATAPAVPAETEVSLASRGSAVLYGMRVCCLLPQAALEILRQALKALQQTVNAGTDSAAPPNAEANAAEPNSGVPAVVPPQLPVPLAPVPAPAPNIHHAGSGSALTVAPAAATGAVSGAPPLASIPAPAAAPPAPAAAPSAAGSGGSSSSNGSTQQPGRELSYQEVAQYVQANQAHLLPGVVKVDPRLSVAAAVLLPPPLPVSADAAVAHSLSASVPSTGGAPPKPWQLNVNNVNNSSDTGHAESVPKAEHDAASAARSQAVGPDDFIETIKKAALRQELLSMDEDGGATPGAVHTASKDALAASGIGVKSTGEPPVPESGTVALASPEQSLKSGLRASTSSASSAASSAPAAAAALAEISPIPTMHTPGHTVAADENSPISRISSHPPANVSVRRPHRGQHRRGHSHTASKPWLESKDETAASALTES
jgi:hypothetical protein